MDPQNKQAVSVPARRSEETTGKYIFLWIVNILVAAAAVTLLVSSVLFPMLMVSGDSMEPGLIDGDLILMRRTHTLQSGDLVSFKWSDKTVLKRVIACPGDWVMLDEAGRVYVNGTLLDEPYVAEFSLGESDAAYPLQVPDGSYFVMGDERKSSLDSRSTLVGCVQYDQIIGKGILLIRSGAASS